MRNPTRVLVWMVLFTLVVALASVALLAPLSRAFFANLFFNGTILFVLFVGWLINFRQVLVLTPETRWLEEFRRGDARHLEPPQRGLLASAARILTQHQGQRLQLSAQTMRALLDGIRSRLDESRDMSRYVISLLIFLGLLGTFWGLLETLAAVANLINGLSVGEGDFGVLFEELKTGLSEPLEGMGTAFSSSLFGLAGALILGFFDLQAGHAQNRFYNDLEEWLSGVTRVGGGGLAEEPVPVYIQALLEQTADSLEKLQRVMTRNEEEHRSANARVINLASQVAGLIEELKGEQRQLATLAQGQADLPVVMARLNTEIAGLRELNQEVRHHLGNIDTTLTNLSGDMNSGRLQMVEELRDEIRLLTRTIARGNS